MAIEDKLKEMINSWIKEREKYAEQLRELARVLEELSKTCKTTTRVGLGAVVGGGICMIAAVVATIFTAGLASPLLVAAGTSAGVGIVGLVVGLGVAATAEIIEAFKSSSNLEKAKEIESKIKKIEKLIKESTERLKKKKKKKEKENKDMGYSGNQYGLDRITKLLAAAEAVGLTAKEEYPLIWLIETLVNLIKGKLLPKAIQTLIDSANDIEMNTGTVRYQLHNRN